MANVVTRGGTLHTTWSLYRPVVSGLPSELVDPDEFPEGPRFAVTLADDTPVDGYEELLYTVRRGVGVFALNLAIPFGDAFDPGDYKLVLARGSVGGNTCVDAQGNPLSAAFTVLIEPKAEDFSTQRPYVTPDELYTDFGVTPKPGLKEVLFAQGVLDDWMHRSLWPTIVERERHNLPADRNTFAVAVTPIIRICAAQASGIDAAPVVGRYGYGRRDRRVLNQASGAYLATMAILGSPPKFTAIDPAQIDYHPQRGECWIPTGFFLINYSQVELTYEAGFRVIPFAAKLALAETVAWVRVKGFGPLTNWSIGRVSHSTGESLVTPEVAARLEPYRLKTYA